MGSESQWDPYLGCFVLRVAIGQVGVMRILEPLRHDTDDLIGLAIEEQCAIENVRAGREHGLPESVANQGDFFVTNLIVAGGNCPAQLWRCKECRKEIAIYPRRACTLCRALRSQAEDRLVEGRHILE